MAQCCVCHRLLGFNKTYYRCSYVETPQGEKSEDDTPQVHCFECHYRSDHDGYHSGYTLCWLCLEDEDVRPEKCDVCEREDCDLYVKVEEPWTAILESSWTCLDCLTDAKSVSSAGSD